MKNHIQSSIQIIAAACVFTALAIVLGTSSAKGTPETDLTAALTALKDHVTGAIPLNAADIEAKKLTIDANVALFGSSTAVIAKAFDLVHTYDTSTNTSARGPLWVKTTLPGRGAVTNDIHWTIYTVMQDIMDETYTSANIANNEALLTGFKFESSANFPGSCSPPADPATPHIVQIDGSFSDTKRPGRNQSQLNRGKGRLGS